MRNCENIVEFQATRYKLILGGSVVFSASSRRKPLDVALMSSEFENGEMHSSVNSTPIAVARSVVGEASDAISKNGYAFTPK